MTYREVVRKLQRLGCVERKRRGGGSHRKWSNPANGRSTAVPDWGSRDLKEGTVRSAIKQLGLDWSDVLRA